MLTLYYPSINDCKIFTSSTNHTLNSQCTCIKNIIAVIITLIDKLWSLSLILLTSVMLCVICVCAILCQKNSLCIRHIGIANIWGDVFQADIKTTRETLKVSVGTQTWKVYNAKHCECINQWITLSRENHQFRRRNIWVIVFITIFTSSPYYTKVLERQKIPIPTQVEIIRLFSRMLWIKVLLCSA